MGRSVPIRSARLIGEASVYWDSHGDTWNATWADDGNIYCTCDDSIGWGVTQSSNLAVCRLIGDDPLTLKGRTHNAMAEYGPLGGPGADWGVWKANGIACVDGILYVSVSRHRSIDTPRGWLQYAMNASITKSTDHGETWVRSADENYAHPMFPGQRFGAPFFIEYGRDYSGSADGADEFVYAISNDGFWNNGNTMILGRVPRKKIAALEGTDWEFYVGGGQDGLDTANWTPNVYAPCSVGMLKATHIVRSPEKLSMTSATYNRALGRYLMPCWHYEDLVPYDLNGQTCKFQKTEWELYQAPAPWGPWTKFASFYFAPEGYYNPCIVSKLISEDGLHCTVFTGGTFSTAGMKGHDCLYRLTTLQIELVA